MAVPRMKGLPIDARAQARHPLVPYDVPPDEASGRNPDDDKGMMKVRRSIPPSDMAKEGVSDAGQSSHGPHP